jgi:hypothetical protein
MRLELDEIVACEGIWRSEEKGERPVERFSRTGITNNRISRATRDDIKRKHCSPNASGIRPADPDNSDCRPPGA